MSAKQAINDKLQCSVATYLRCVGVVNNQIKKSLLLSLQWKKWNRWVFGKVTSKNVTNYTAELAYRMCGYGCKCKNKTKKPSVEVAATTQWLVLLIYSFQLRYALSATLPGPIFPVSPSLAVSGEKLPIMEHCHHECEPLVSKRITVDRSRSIPFESYHPHTHTHTHTHIQRDAQAPYCSTRPQSDR